MLDGLTSFGLIFFVALLLYFVSKKIIGLVWFVILFFVGYILISYVFGGAEGETTSDLQFGEYKKCVELPETEFYEFNSKNYTGFKVYRCTGWFDAAKTHTANVCYIAVDESGDVVNDFCYERFYPTVR